MGKVPQSISMYKPVAIFAFFHHYQFSLSFNFFIYMQLGK